MDYKSTVEKNRTIMCDYCGERPAIHYFSKINKYCCAISVLGCKGVGVQMRSKKNKPYIRPNSEYRKSIMLINEGKAVCHYCGETAYHYASGKFICERLAYNCKNYREWLKERKLENKFKRDQTNYNRKKATLAKYGINIDNANIPDGPGEYGKYLTRIKSLHKRNISTSK